MCREFMIPSTYLEKVEGNGSLWKKSVPQVHGKFMVGGTEAHNEMVLESLDRAFGSVALVISWRHQLKHNVLFFQEKN